MTEMEAHIPHAGKTYLGKEVPVRVGSATVGHGEVTQINTDGSVELIMHIDDEFIAELITNSPPEHYSIGPTWMKPDEVSITPVEVAKDE